MAILYPSLIAVLSVVVFSIIDNRNYKSEWLTADTVIMLTTGTALVYSAIISLLSLTIFLNKSAQIKHNTLFSFLSWFLLPFGFMLTVIVREALFKIKSGEKFDSDVIYVALLNLPFIVSHIWAYRRYRKDSVG
jgi:hypothetical protein